jgi:hypothetical protein
MKRVGRPDESGSRRQRERRRQMPPYDTDPVVMLRIARDRAEELRADWQMANRKRPVHVPAGHGSRRGFARTARETAGKALIGLGRRVLPVEAEPCG